MFDICQTSSVRRLRLDKVLTTMSTNQPTTDFNTIFEDLKTSVKLAKDNILSYALAHIGMGFALIFILAIVAIPVLAFVILSGPVIWTSIADIVMAGPDSSRFLLGGAFGLLFVPFFAVVYTLNGALFGMSKEVIEQGKTKAETSFSFLSGKFLPLMGAGILLTLIIIAPQALVWYVVSYLNGWTIPLLYSQILIVFTYVYSNITSGFCAMVLPAIVNGAGVQDAFKESFRLAIDRFDRVFGVLIGINIVFFALFGPIMVLGLLVPFAWSTLVLAPAVAVIALWTVIAVILTGLLFIPAAYIVWMKVYHELTGKPVYEGEPVEVPMV